MRRNRFMATAVLLTALAGVLAGTATGVMKTGIIAFSRAPDSSDSLPLLSVLRTGESRRIADFADGDVSDARAVFVSRATEGGEEMVCLWDTNLLNGHQGGGCNYAYDPFGGRRMMVSLAFDGGPALETITEARIIGLVDPAVVSVGILQANGKTTDVRLSPDRAFAVAYTQSDILHGRAPVAVIGRDVRHAVIDQEPLQLG